MVEETSAINYSVDKSMFPDDVTITHAYRYTLL